MQRFMRHRKLMAFVLAVCMVVPLISNQYLIVRAEEPNNIADTTQQEGEDDSGDKTDIDEAEYMSESATPITEADITELSLDNQVDLSTLEKQNVSFTRSNDNMSMDCTDTHYWLKVNVPEGSTYIITNLYTLETYCSTSVYRYDEEKGALYGDGGYISLKEAGDIYTLTSGLYYINFYSETPVQTTLSLKEQAPATKIVELKDSAYEVTSEDIENGTVTLTKQEGYYTCPDFQGKYYDDAFTCTYGNLIKITVPANMHYNLSSSFGVFLVYGNDIDKLLSISTMSTSPVEYNCEIANNTDSDVTYYVWFKMSDNDSDIPQFKIQVAQKLADMKDSAYEVTAADIENGTVTLTKQKGYYTYPCDDGKYLYTSKYGNLIKLIVPANTEYILEASQASFKIFDADIEREISSGNGNASVINATDDVKTYYVWFMMNEETPQFKLQAFQNQKLVDIKESAYEVTADDIKNRTVTLTKQEGCYTYPNSKGDYVYTSTYGSLVKITVPANTEYNLSAPSGYLYVYDADIEKALVTWTHNYCLVNNNDGEKIYYIWLEMINSEDTPQFQIQKPTYIKDIKDSAYEVTTEDIENGTVTLTKQEGDYRYPDFNGEYTMTSKCGNLIKITVPANTEYGLSTVDGIFYVYDEDMDKLLKVSMTDNTCEIENNTDSDTVYYVWFKMNDSEAIPQFKIQVPQKLIYIKDSAYEVTADDIGNGTISLTRQEGYYTYPDSHGEYTHVSSYGNLIKVTVPANTTYVLSTEQGDFTIYDDSMDKEISSGYLSGYRSITNETDTEKTYYVWLKMYMYEYTPQFEIKTAQRIADMKDSAYEVTTEDVENGTVTLTLQKGCYTYPDSDGKYTYASKCGRLIKITVPANTIYDLSSPDHLLYASISTYGEDIEKMLSKECIINNTDSESVYYVWVNDTYGSNYDSWEIQFEINKTDRLNSLKDKAYVVTSEDINKGTITIDTLEGCYSLPDSNGEYTYTSSNGNLLKITVPAHKAYKFKCLHFTFFDANIEKRIYPESGFSQDIINNTDGDAIYYVWVQSPFSGTTVDFEISELQKLIDIKDSAYEVTAEDIENGTVTLTKQDGYYIYPDYSGEYTNTSSYGNLVKIRVPANTGYRLSATNGRFYVYNTDISKALANNTYNYLLENDTYSEVEYYVWLVMNTSTITSQLQIEEVDDFKHLSDLEADAIELVGDEYTANESHLDTVNIPVSVSNEGIVSYDKSSGKLYKLTLTAKNMVTITDSNETDKLYIYGDGDLDEVPIVYGDGSVIFSNLGNETKTYYLWVAGDNSGITITKSIETMDSKENVTASGKTVDTTVDTTDKGASIIVSENKDTSDNVEEAVVKVSVADAADSDEAIQKGIDVIMQYNSDNEGKAQVDRIEVSYSGDESVTVSANTINSLKNLQGNVSLEVSKKSGEDADKTVYTWKFKPESIETVEAVNTKIDIYENAIGYENKTVVDNLTDKAATKCVLAFEHNGVLPENTEVTVGVADQYTDGTELYYYHIDIANNKLEEIGATVVENGCATLKLSHCSDYVMSNKPVCQHSNTGIRGQKSASCIAEGYTGDKYCKDCGIQLSTGTTIPKTAHVAGQWIIDKEATVDAEGSMHTECTVCKTVLDTKKIDKLPAPKPEPTPAPTTDATVTASGVYVASHTKDTIVVGLVAEPSKTADLEYRWLVCDTSVDSNAWTEIQGWTKNNEWLTWKPGKTGDYVIVGQVRVVGNEESQSQASVGIPHHAQIKGKCQMPYTGEGGGYLIGIESYDNPNQEYTYELLVLDCTLLAEGKDAWVWTTGRCKVPETSFWAVWQPQYGYYWTLFRVYDKDGNLIDQECYSFVNAY